MNRSQNPASLAIRIQVAKQFSPTPGARYRDDGDWSGQQFREELLEPAYREVARTGGRVIVNLDDCEGFATSFLEEAFGGLVRKVGSAREVQGVVSAECADEPALVEDVEYYIAHALDEDR